MVPLRLLPYFVCESEKNKGFYDLVTGHLLCCNSNNFNLKYSGNLRSTVFNKLQLSPDTNNCLSLAATCNHCLTSIYVFDSMVDGYDHINTFFPFTSAELPVCCSKCEQNDFSINITFEYPPVDDLLVLNADDINNGFSWIRISIKCNCCGTTSTRFINFETA